MLYYNQKGVTMINFKQYIGKRFIVKGFNEPRELEIVEGYFLGNNKRYPTFKCKVITDTKYFKVGDRENFLYRDIIKAGQLVKEIKVLSA
jgi:hypothetical protein